MKQEVESVSCLYRNPILDCGMIPMTEERKHAILLATVILTARRLQPLLEEGDRECKPNLGGEFWPKVIRAIDGTSSAYSGFD